MRRVAQVRFRDHAVHIELDTDTDRIVCFKHDHSRCDWAVFTCDQEDQAREWIITELPRGSYQFVSDEDLL